MLQLEKKYLGGGLDADSADFIVGEGDLINAFNLRFGTTEAGAIGFLESVPGTSTVFTIPGSGTNTPICAVTDEAGRRLIAFFHNSLGTHGIYCYDLQSNLTYSVLLNADVTGGLNFSLTQFIDARIIGDLLYWTDYLTDPRRINIQAAIKHYYPSYVTTVEPYSTPLAKSVLTLIRRQPGYPLNIEKFYQVSPVVIANFIKDTAFEFAYRYVYRDFEVSAFSMLSKLANYNTATGQENSVIITVPLSEPIAQDVSRLELAVKFIPTGKMYVIKSWDKKNADDLAEIALHNAGTTALKYIFYNSEVGIAVDDALGAKPYDVVPLRSRTLEIARNRLFLAGNVFGFNSPVKTSLAITTEITGSGDVIGTWSRLEYNLPGGGTQVKYLVGIWTIGMQSGYYESIAITSMPPPAIINFPDLNLAGAGFTSLLSHYGITQQDVVSFTGAGGYTSIVTNGPVLLDLVGSRYLKSDTAYQLGIWFFDFAGRKCGVVTNKTLRKTTSDRSFAQPQFITGFGWTLSNTDALIEIPVEAVSYAIGRTKSLRTNFFMQQRSDGMVYVDKTSAGVYTTTDTSWTDTRVGLGINIKSLAAIGMGYVYNPGDILKFWTSTQSYSVKITGQVGDYVITDPVNLGSLVGMTVMYEIYTPYRESAIEPFYELGEMYAVLTPGTGTRSYSVTSGVIQGDIYLLNRTKSGVAYFTENMSPADKFYKDWWHGDIGRFNIVDRIGQQVRTSSVAWSNKFIPGTQTNGLGTFDALDVTDMPLENGEVYKLQLTSKTQDEGSVMLAICKNETSSLYLGETQVLGADGNAFLATSQGVIGSINMLKGSYGTIHPESVKFYEGNVYWWDVYNGAIVQYSSNGLFPVSNYKMTRFLRRYSKRYIEQNLTARAPGGIDPYNKEYLLVLPAVEAGGFTPQLPGVVSKPNEFDIYDGIAKTLQYKIGADRFGSPYIFTPSCFEYIGVQLFGLKGGSIYKHNDVGATDNFFYGVQYTTKIMFLSNSLPHKLKVYNAISIEANMAPTYTCFYGLNPNEQITDLVAGDYKLKEGVYYAPLLRDRLSPNKSGTADQKLIIGDKMRTPAMRIMLEFTTTSKKLQLRFVNINFHVASGQLT